MIFWDPSNPTVLQLYDLQGPFQSKHPRILCSSRTLPSQPSYSSMTFKVPSSPGQCMLLSELLCPSIPRSARLLCALLARPCSTPCPCSVPRHLSGGADGGGADREAGSALQHLLPADQPDLQAGSNRDPRADQRRGNDPSALLFLPFTPLCVQPPKHNLRVGPSHLLLLPKSSLTKLWS